MVVRPGPWDSPAVMSFSAMRRRSVWRRGLRLRGGGGGRRGGRGRQHRGPVGGGPAGGGVGGGGGDGRPVVGAGGGWPSAASATEAGTLATTGSLATSRPSLDEKSQASRAVGSSATSWRMYSRPAADSRPWARAAEAFV